MKKTALMLAASALLLSGCASTGKPPPEDATAEEIQYWDFCARWGVVHPKCFFVHIQDMLGWGKDDDGPKNAE